MSLELLSTKCQSVVCKCTNEGGLHFCSPLCHASMLVSEQEDQPCNCGHESCCEAGDKEGASRKEVLDLKAS